ncbi:uncharacterized protein LOC131611589 isoform X3 [Vicia villosa]|uniref:uncharacterized protein LOC131611589 isoform X3 n=1 Tax=Vicia villosa TaxID=3911 RepID=UPI00273B533A|nr:uncharacterized protein LOC131611589 isoform X3 [Vicia villosa]
MHYVDLNQRLRLIGEACELCTMLPLIAILQLAFCCCNSIVFISEKRPRGRPPGSGRKQQLAALDGPAEDLYEIFYLCSHQYICSLFND